MRFDVLVDAFERFLELGKHLPGFDPSPQAERPLLQRELRRAISH